MKIGYACIPLTIDAKNNRRIMIKNFSKEKFLQAVEQNLFDLKRILENNKKYNINLFRISSDIIPLGSHSINNVSWQECFKEQLSDIGEYIKSNNMRVSMHPGQYTVLNSHSEDVVVKAIEDLEYHSRFLDALCVDASNKIILHVGGIYGEKASAINRFITNFNRLSDSVKNRLVIENDEKNYTIEDVIYIGKRLGIPVIFDNLHHKCNKESPNWHLKDIIEKVSTTWKSKDGNIKVHYSQQDNDKKEGAHSKTINLKEFLEYYNQVKEFNIDIMLEVKDKDISAIKCNYAIAELYENKDIERKFKKGVIYNEWAKYKYIVMEKNYKYYKECSGMVKENCTLIEFYQYIDIKLKTTGDNGSFINAAEHVWGYVKNKVSQKEKNHYKKLLEDIQNKDKIKAYLKKLCAKYNADYMLESYYFWY